jgi:RNA polymerase sigma-70 factor (ECF subfamily)
VSRTDPSSSPAARPLAAPAQNLRHVAPPLRLDDDAESGAEKAVVTLFARAAFAGGARPRAPWALVAEGAGFFHGVDYNPGALPASARRGPLETTPMQRLWTKAGHAGAPPILDEPGLAALAGSRASVPGDPTSALLARLADGDRGVSSELFQALWTPVRRLAGAMLQNDADADDAAQDAIVTIFERVAGYDRTRAGLPWALAIAGFACRTLRKKRLRRREEPEGAAPTSIAEDSPEAKVEQRELVEAALTVLESLTDVERETLIATYWDEQASASGATLRKRRERALDRLRSLFGRIYGLR